MSERDIPHEISRELFLNPAIDVDDNEEYETLRELHEEESKREQERKEKS